jgi:hypothetical protein
MPKMPANNRMHSSAALQTHGIWANTIGYDPYAPNVQKQAEDQPAPNSFDSFKGLLALARLTGSASTTVKGQCKKCGGAGHLTFQCRNHLRPTHVDDDVSTTSSDSSDSDSGGEKDKPKPGVQLVNPLLSSNIPSKDSNQSTTSNDKSKSSDEKHKHKHGKHKHKHHKKDKEKEKHKHKKHKKHSKKDKEHKKHKKEKKEKKEKKDKHRESEASQ